MALAFLSGCGYTIEYEENSLPHFLHYMVILGKIVMAKKADSTLTKITWQYTEILPEETLEFLRGIVADYGKVKAAVFDRYSGIRSLEKPVFDIMTEMRHCGLREQLNLPSAYYEAAVKEAAENIKGMWSSLKNRLRKLISDNENLTEDGRFYLRYILKADEIYGAVLNRREHQLPEKLQARDIDVNRLNNLLRRLTRKYLVKPSVGTIDAFSVPAVGYSYKGGALRLASRTKQKRVILPLRDNYA